MTEGSRIVRGMAATAIALATAAALAACTGTEHHGHGARPGSAVAPLLYSPNGEPLSGGPLGQPSCALAMANWFDRVDTSHDGRIDRDEFLADARAQFARMDVDRLGYLTSDELERFRQPYRQGTRQPVTGSADPVLSADTDLDFKVTLDEFLRQAGDIFERLDTDHGGAIDRSELAPLCAGAQPPEQQPPEQQQPNERQPPGDGRRGHDRGGSGADRPFRAT